MKDYSKTKAGQLIQKTADEQAAKTFFRPDFTTVYELLDDTKPLTIGGKKVEHLQLEAESGKISLIRPTALSGFFMTEESKGSTFKVIDHQDIDQAYKAIGEGLGKFKFVEGDECLVYSRKYNEDLDDEDQPKEGEVLIETSTKKFFMKPGKLWKIEKAV